MKSLPPRAIAGLSMLALSLISWAQGDPSTLDRIVQVGKNDNKVMNHLDELTHNIGSRLTGSPRLLKAQHWADGKFKSFGLTNVHLEKWGEIPVGWEREPDTYGKMVSPYDIDMQFTTPDWSEGTNGPLRGLAIVEPTSKADFEKVKAQLKGAWVITAGSPRRRTTDVDPKDEVAVVRQMVDQAGIAGRVYGSRGELVQTSGTWVGKSPEKHPLDRSVVVTKNDMERIKRNLDYGRPVQLEFNLDNKWFKGPVPQYNVVAEIKGTEKPDEVVIVSGHLDSWDGPGSQGALDNGVGSCTAIEAARILMKAHAMPKRTIRFILWSGEEQGLFGSVGYVKIHQAEMDKISAVLVDDGGTNYQGGYVGPENMRSMMEAAYAPTVKAFPQFPMHYKVVSSIKRQEGGSDHASFWKYRVPGFFTIETGRHNYLRVHHSQFDRFEEAIPEYLVQSSTNHAIVSYNLACANTLVPRDPLPPAPSGS